MKGVRNVSRSGVLHHIGQINARCALQEGCWGEYEHLQQKLAVEQQWREEAEARLMTLEIAVHTLGVQPAGTTDSDKAWATVCDVAQNLDAAVRQHQKRDAWLEEVLLAAQNRVPITRFIWSKDLWRILAREPKGDA